MADPSHVAIFLTGPDPWNKWRLANPAIVPDLAGLCLPLRERGQGGGSFNLGGADLSGSDLRFMFLPGAQFRGARLSQADFSHAQLEGCDFTGADCCQAQFEAAGLNAATFNAALLSGANLSRATHLTSVQIAAAIGDESTELPNGLPRPETWVDGRVQPNGRPYGFTRPDLLYRLLGVGQAAQEPSIRRAFLDAAKVLHPDRRPGEFGAQEAFKTLSAAADLLLDPVQRARYDRGEIDGKGQSTAIVVKETAFSKPKVFAAAGTFSLTLALCAGFIFYNPWRGQEKRSVVAVERIVLNATPKSATKAEAAGKPSMSSASAFETYKATPDILNESFGLTMEPFKGALTSLSASVSNSPLVSARDTAPATERTAVSKVEKLSRLFLEQRSRQQIAEFSIYKAAASENEDHHDDGKATPDQVTLLHPDSVEGLIVRGNASDERGDGDAAMRDYDRALLLDPDSKLALYNRGIANARKGDLANALSDFDRAIRDTFSEAWLYDTRGVVWCQKEQFDRAIADFSHALRVDPALASALRHRALALAARRRFAEALADIDNAIELQPDFAWAYAYRALVHAFNAQQKDARADLERALALDSGDPGLRDFEGRLAAASNITAEAATDAARLVRQAAFQAQVVHRVGVATRVGIVN